MKNNPTWTKPYIIKKERKNRPNFAKIVPTLTTFRAVTTTDSNDFNDSDDYRLSTIDYGSPGVGKSDKIVGKMVKILVGSLSGGWYGQRL